MEEIERTPTAVHVLAQQRRMHPDVCDVVSEFQYDGFLSTADDRIAQKSNLAPLLADFSRTIWYVLDDEAKDLSDIRADRGPGNKSWIRAITPSILQKLFTNPQVRASNGMFISPYKAQAQWIADLLGQWDMPTWESSTVHSQQGSESDIVIFDTVNAGSYNWPFDEWKRLINVALSRAREAVVVLASRNEMDEPYLRPLIQNLSPALLVANHSGYVWQPTGAIVSAKQQSNTQQPKAQRSVAETKADYQVKPNSKPRQRVSQLRIGDQFNDRKQLKPVLSREQQRLSNLELDGKPRLVRGVAGSGKSLVLCNWLAKTAQRFHHQVDQRIWAVYANRSLHKLFRESIETAWEHLHEGELLSRPDFPWQRVSLMHVKDVLAGLLPSVKMSMTEYGFDYDRAAAEFLNRQDADELLPRCSALFIDEAQDMGPSTLRLLLSIVEKSDDADSNSRPAHIFYDNAQNVYGTATPKWSDFGLDLRGRSTIMRESFRSTTPITELAVNVLDRLSGASERQDKQELLSLDLLQPVRRGGEDWLQVNFNQVHGPKPIFRGFENRSDEIESIATHLQHLIEQEGISPTDIVLIYNGQAKEVLTTELSPKLAEIGVELSLQTNRTFERKSNTLIATTPQSYKGYESEVVMIPCVDTYIAPGPKILANSLYVAMTRARSLLAIYGNTAGSTPARKLTGTIATCVRALDADPLPPEY